MIDFGHGDWTLGTYFFWPFMVFGLFLIAAGTIGVAITRDSDVAKVAILPGVLVVLASGFFYWPVFDSSFHRLYPVQGTVTSISSRLISNDKSVSQRYVIRFAEGPDLFGCDDSRCSAATLGAHVKLLCKKQWQFRGTPGWVCVYDQVS